MDPVEPLEEAQVAAALVRRIRDGDNAAESEMVDRYSVGLLFFLRRRTGDPALADDLHQEVVRTVLTRLRQSGIEEPEKLSAFLHRTANNLIIAGFRKAARRRTETGQQVAGASVPASQLDRVVRRERAAVVRRLLAELEPRRDRELLVRFYLAEQEKEQICAELGLSKEHFKRVLHRARRRFRDLLEGFHKRQRLERATVARPSHAGDGGRVTA